MAEFFRLDGQVALVTGAGQGIGAGIARRLHAAGARVAVFDRDPGWPGPSPGSSTAWTWSAMSARRTRSPRPSSRPRPGSGRCRSWSTMPGSPAAPT